MQLSNKANENTDTSVLTYTTKYKGVKMDSGVYPTYLPNSPGAVKQILTPAIPSEQRQRRARGSSSWQC